MSRTLALEIDGEIIDLAIERLPDGVSIRAYDGRGVDVAPIYTMRGLDAAAPGAADLESLLDFLEGELRRRRLITLSGTTLAEAPEGEGDD